jgi:hypothetical protein
MWEELYIRTTAKKKIETLLEQNLKIFATI